MSISFSIFSYNIAGKRDDFAKTFISNILSNNNQSETDIFIFCFQEVHGNFDESFTLPNVKVIYIQNGCKGSDSKFNLSTVILRKINFDDAIQTRRFKKCTHFGVIVKGFTLHYFGSKGAIYTILTIKDQSYLIINTHAPFATQKGILGGSYSTFWDSFIQTQIEKNNMQGKTFIIGDLNSRSLISNDFDINQTTKIKNAQQEHFRYRSTQNNEPIEFRRQVQTLMNKAQYKTQTMTKEEKQKFQKLKKRMVDRDYLTFFLKQLSTNIRDIQEIKFLPTYKINQETLQYKLRKDGNLRLPGYADRILTDIDKDNFQDITYKALKKFGSTDHFPVTSTFSLKEL